jgi:RNA-directed DNA polymerase
MGLTISEEKSTIRLASQTFKFLGFQVAYVKTQGKFRVRITPSKGNVIRIIAKTRKIIQYNKASSAYELIGRLRPVLLGWANYFQFCECKETFSKVDNIVFQQIRAWVFRRAVRQGRLTVKEKYFPSHQTYKFQNSTYKAQWILNGTKTLKDNKAVTIYLPKLSWIKRKKYVKIKGNESIFIENKID